MRLDVLSKDECERVRLWRNECLETLRTPYPLTAEQEEAFYREVVCNPQAPHRYWAIVNDSEASAAPERSLLGMGGLTYIQWVNRIAEISLILDPAVRGKGLGEQAVDLILAEGFDRMGLKTICGECYTCNDEGLPFWQKIMDRFRHLEKAESSAARLPNRKFWKGEFWDSLYFSIDADDWRKVHGLSA